MANPILKQAGLDRPRLDAAMSGSQEANAGLISATDEVVKATTQATEDTSRAAEQKGGANKILQRAQLDNLARQQQSNQAVYTAAGASEGQTALVNQLKAEQERVAALLDKQTDIMDDEHTGFDIIDSLINGWRAIGTQRDLRFAREEQEHTARSIGQLANAQSSFISVNNAVDRTVTESVVEANMSKLDAETTIEAKRTKLEGLRNNTAAMQLAVSTSKANVDQLLQSYRIEGEVADRGHRAKAMEMDIQRWQTEGPMRELQMKNAELGYEERNRAIKEDAALRENLSYAVNSAEIAAGVQPTAPETVMYALSKGGELGAKFQKLAMVGANSDRIVLGSTPSEAKNTLALVSPEGNYEETKSTKLMDSFSRQQEAVYATNPSVRPRSGDTAKASEDYDTLVRNEMAKYAADVSTPGNPYASPPIAALAPKLEGKGNIVYDYLLKGTGLVELNPEVVLDLVAGAMVGTPEVEPNQLAEDIAHIYKLAAHHNNTFQGGFERYGLPLQSTYNVYLKRDSTWAEGAKDLATVTAAGLLGPVSPKAAGGVLSARQNRMTRIDMMDAAEVKQALVTRILSGTTGSPTNSKNEGTK